MPIAWAKRKTAKLKRWQMSLGMCLAASMRKPSQSLRAIQYLVAADDRFQRGGVVTIQLFQIEEITAAELGVGIHRVGAVPVDDGAAAVVRL